MLFSIIVPMYNVECYIEKCITSILDQDFDDYEIIIINDCSTDNSFEKVQSYSTNTKVRIINKKSNTGLSDTRNVGLLASKGEYIIFVDSDDYMSKDALSMISGDIREQKMPDILYYGYIEHEGRSEVTRYGYVSESNTIYNANIFMKNELESRNLYAPVWCGVYRNSFLNDIPILFKVGRLHEDEMWTPLIILSANTVYTSKKIIYHYIRREGSISKAKDRTKNGMDLLLTATELDEICRKKIKDPHLKKLFGNHIAKLYMKGLSIGKLYKKEHKNLVQRLFPLQRSVFFYDKLKSIVFALSPRLYCMLNELIKGK